jgi:hypothetical protein
VQQQQDDVMAQLEPLGATELARVQYARNAIAVSMPSSAVDRSRKIVGVTAIQPITHRNRIDD